MRDPFFAVAGVAYELYRVVSRYIVVILAAVVVHGPFAFSLAHCFILQCGAGQPAPVRLAVVRFLHRLYCVHKLLGIDLAIPEHSVAIARGVVIIAGKFAIV